MTEQQMNSNPTYQQPLCSPCATCDESNTTTTRKRDVNKTKTTANDAVKCVPQLRFPEFQNTGEWKPVTLKDIGKTYNGLSGKSGGDFGTGEPYVAYKQVFNGTTIKIEDCPLVAIKEGEKQNKLKKGDILVTISSETAQEIGMVNVITEDFKRSVYLNSFCFIFRPHNNCFIPSFAKYLFSSPSYRKQIISIAQGITRYNVSKDNFLKLTLFIPNLDEQQKIASCLLSIDNAISATTQKLEQLKTHKKALLQKLFPQRGKTIPEFRFPEFKDAGTWQEKRIGEIFKRIKERNRKNIQNVLTISAQYGLVSQYDYFHKNVAAADVSNYSLLKKGDFAYNKSRSQGYLYGAIKPLKLYNEGVVSTLYICFRLKNNKYCNDFFEQYFETKLMRDELGKIAQEGARHHGLLNISTDDFFENVIVLVPSSVNEQQKIASCFQSIDDDICALMKKLELIQMQKKSLMQQLFVK